MEFPVETTGGDFGDIAVESMETEGAGEIHYVYDDSAMVHGDSGDYSNITDLVLEDGTRAMIVNGTLVTADGQTLILQDGSDLSQYSVDDNADEIVISKEQEDQFLQIMTSQDGQNEDQKVFHYVQDDSGDIAIKRECEQQILYIQDGQNILPIEEKYHIAQLDSQNSNEAMQVIKLENEQILDEDGGVIDLEQLLLSQQATVHLDSGEYVLRPSYQYAVLKDGKIHFQGTDSAVDVSSVQEMDGSEIILDQSPQFSSTDFLDLSAIKGRNIKTGQVITLSRHMDKTLNKKLKSMTGNKKETIKHKFEEKLKTTIPPSSTNLRQLINKKITIGQTDKGKLLVGKIVNVMKKTDIQLNKSNFKNSSLVKNAQAIQKTGLTTNRKLKQISKISLKRVINLVEDEESNPVEEVSNKTTPATGNCNSNRITNTSYQPQLVTMSSNEKKDDHEKGTVTQKPMLNEAVVIKKEINSVQNEHPTKSIEGETLENGPDFSKIIVHQKVVTKDCFDVITRTMTGLMNMDSVVKKLKNRTIIIKIIQKMHNQDTNDYSKTISYCSGYMVREYKLDVEDGSFSESWRFIPDTNSKETILGRNNFEPLLQDGGVASQNCLKKFANLTFQITVNPEGNRTTRVIINPPAMFQCKACSKSFRTSGLLKIHSMECHPSPGLECARCSLKFKTVTEAKEHSATRHAEENKGMYECVECKQCFMMPHQIRLHMEMHYKPHECSLCNNISFSSMKELSKHMLVHADSQPAELSSIASVEQEDGNNKLSERKVFSCHICTRQFSRYSNLQRHIDIHQGEGAMYQCAICSCSYHYISSLTRHVVSCHVDKSKKLSQNENCLQTDSQDADSVNQDQDLQFLQDDQIVQMIPLEHMSEESLQQYVTENMEYVTPDFQEAGVQILQIPVDSSIVIED